MQDEMLQKMLQNMLHIMLLDNAEIDVTQHIKRHETLPGHVTCVALQHLVKFKLSQPNSTSTGV